MGQADSRIVEFAEELDSLEEDVSKWDKILQQFIELNEENDFTDAQFDIKILNQVTDLLYPPNISKIKHRENIQGQDRRLVLKTMICLMKNRHLFCQIYEGFDTMEKLLMTIDTFVIMENVALALTFIQHVIHFTEDNEKEAEEDNKYLFVKYGGIEFLINLLNTLEGTNQGSEQIYHSIIDILESYFVTRKQSTSLQVSKRVIIVIQNQFTPLLNVLHHKNLEIRSRMCHFIKHFSYLVIDTTTIDDQFRTSGELLWQIKMILNDYDDTSIREQTRRLSQLMLSLFCKKSAENRTYVQQLLPPPVYAWLQPTNDKLQWKIFIENLFNNYNEPRLIWNYKTRAELRDKVNRQIDTISFNQEGEDYFIEYESLFDMVYVGGYYLKLLEENWGTYKRENVEFIEQPIEFLDDLYDALVLEENLKRQLLIIVILRKLVGTYSSCFEKCKRMNYFTFLLKPKIHHEIWIEELLLLLKKLFVYPENIKTFIQTAGIDSCIYHLCQAQTIEFMEQKENATQGKLFQHAAIINILALLEGVSMFQQARKQLTLPQNFSYIVQTLLLNERNILNQTIILIMKVLKSTKSVPPVLYKTGIFSFIMRHMDQNCTQVMALFLKEYHLIQAHDDVAQIPSILDYYLPRPLIEILVREKGVEQFVEAMNTDSNMDPYLIWSKEHRKKMVEHVNKSLAEFIEHHQKDPTLVYTYNVPIKINYEDIQQEICIENIYLKRYVSSEQIKIDEPDVFLKGLLKALQTKNQPDHLKLILEAQTRLIEQDPTLESFQQYPAFPLLFDMLVGDLNDIIVHSVLDLIYVILKQPVSISKNNAEQFLNREGIFKILQLIDLRKEHVHLNQKVYNILIILASRYSIASRLSNAHDFFFKIGKLVFDQFDDMIETASALLWYLSKYDSMLDAQREAGIHMLIIYALIKLAPLIEKDDQHALFQSERLAQYIHKTKSLSTALNLQYETFLTHNLCQLDKVDDFLHYFYSNVERADLFWNGAMRNELLEFLEKNLLTGYAKKTFVFDKTTSFSFNAIKDEIVVDHVYLSVMNRKKQLSNVNLNELLLTLFDRVSTYSKADPFMYHREMVIVCQAIRFLFECNEHANLKRFFLENFILDETLPTYSSVLDYFSLLQRNEEQKEIQHQLQHEIFETITLLSKEPQLFEKMLMQPQLFMRLIIPIQRLILIDENYKVLDLLKAIVTSKSIIEDAIQHGVLIVVLSLLSNQYPSEIRLKASEIIGLICLHQDALLILLRLLHKKFKKYLLSASTSPDLLLYYYDETLETPEIIWNEPIRKDFMAYVQGTLVEIKSTYIKSTNKQMFSNLNDRYQWKTSSLAMYSQPHLEQELQVADVYIRPLNENQSYMLPERINVENLVNSIFDKLSEIYVEGHSQEHIVIAVQLWKALVPCYKQHLHDLERTITTYVPFMLNHFSAPHYSEDFQINEEVLHLLSILSKERTLCTLMTKEEQLHVLLEFVIKQPEHCQSIVYLFSQLVHTSSTFLKAFLQHGGSIILIYFLLKNSSENDFCLLISSMLISLANDQTEGFDFQKQFCGMTTPKFMLKFDGNPSSFLSFFFSDHSTQDKSWNDHVRGELKQQLEALLPKIANQEYVS